MKELLGSSPTETYQRYRWQEDASKRMVFVEERGCVSHHWENRARQAVSSGGECVSVLATNPGQGPKAVLRSLLKALMPLCQVHCWLWRAPFYWEVDFQGAASVDPSNTLSTSESHEKGHSPDLLPHGSFLFVFPAVKKLFITVYSNSGKRKLLLVLSFILAGG